MKKTNETNEYMATCAACYTYTIRVFEHIPMSIAKFNELRSTHNWKYVAIALDEMSHPPTWPRWADV